MFQKIKQIKEDHRTHSTNWDSDTRYNLVNGTKECESGENLKKLLDLKDDFFVMSDWISAVSDGVEMLRAGTGIEMPWAWRTRGSVLKGAIGSGKLSVEQDIDPKIKRVLRAMQKVGVLEKGSTDGDAGAVTVNKQTKKRARKYARSGMVLLKNENGVLPFTKAGYPSMRVVLGNVCVKKTITAYASYILSS